MPTLVIVDGLVPENFSPTDQFIVRPENLGRQEIGRLVGLGRAAGSGPLPRFVQAAANAARENAEEIRLVFFAGEHNAEQAADESLIEVVREHTQGFEILEAMQGSVPWRQILDIAGDPFGDAGDGNAGLKRALLVGAHTELRITSMAVALKNLLSFDSVAICPHLVGSATQAAHFAALRYGLPALGVDVLLDIDDAARYVGIDSARLVDLEVRSCTLGPPAIVERLDGAARDMIKRLCMHWTGASLSTLTGGFSGSLLFIAEGQQRQARTEPMVIKIDNARQMRRELAGYYRVKDLVGKHVPAFGFPVTGPDLVGIGMELAAMEGAPETLQEMFEEAKGAASAKAFKERFAKSLQILTERLYRNTAREEWIVPYREFQIHTDEQVTWLGENIENIVSKAKEEGIPVNAADAAELQAILRLVARNENGTTTSVCLSHGDLNYQNIIADQASNLWFIDWTHAGDTPVALDFAKLENDVKFVLSKDFNADDIPRLRMFEEYLLENPEPGHAEVLAEPLGFVKSDFRYRKILDTVRQIREICLKLLPEDGWLVYRIALLRYATHTLSFDQWGGRGECGPVTLLYALHSVEELLYQLVADDFHLRIRIEKPADYPDRQVILIDEAPWNIDCDQYDPPYYVAPEVLATAKADERRSHPENFEKAVELVDAGRSERKDDKGRPLNPRGRTGLAGRGSLNRWGANPGIAAVVVCKAVDGAGLQFLVGKQAGHLGASLPCDLLELGESTSDGLRRILAASAGLDLGDTEAEPIFDDFFYDLRQTDHAWVELEAWLIGPGARLDSVSTGPTELFDEIDWWPLDNDAMNKLPSGDARLIAKAIDCLRASGQLGQSVEKKNGIKNS